MSLISVITTSTKVQAKHLPQVLALPAQSLELWPSGVSKASQRDLKDLEPVVSMVPRWISNTNLQHRQLIGYVYLTRMNEGVKEVYVYRRTKKVGESRLAGLASIGFGGHIEFDDVVHEHGVLKLEATLIKSIARECAEEAGLKLSANGDLNDTDIRWILDNANAVGRAHVGLAIEIEARGFEPVLEEELNGLGWFSIDAIKAPAADLGFEPWTRLLLDAL